jgi:PAS domain-containing protein
VIGAERTLLSYLDAPVVVGDPDGCAVYANPAFELCFERAVGRVPGAPLAELFEGGAREAVLRAVVVAASQGESVRFRLREGAQGFAAVASPIASGGESVGVVILLKEEVEGVERVLALHRTMEQPMDELGQVVQQLLELPVVAREARLRALLGDAQQALARLRKGADEVHAMLTGHAARGAGKAGRASAQLRAAALLPGRGARRTGRAERGADQWWRRLACRACPGIRRSRRCSRLVETRLAGGSKLDRLC